MRARHGGHLPQDHCNLGASIRHGDGGAAQSGRIREIWSAVVGWCHRPWANTRCRQIYLTDAYDESCGVTWLHHVCRNAAVPQYLVEKTRSR